LAVIATVTVISAFPKRSRIAAHRFPDTTARSFLLSGKSRITIVQIRQIMAVPARDLDSRWHTLELRAYSANCPAAVCGLGSGSVMKRKIPAGLLWPAGIMCTQQRLTGTLTPISRLGNEAYIVPDNQRASHSTLLPRRNDPKDTEGNLTEAQNFIKNLSDEKRAMRSQQSAEKRG
jgi:hypothetical protein